MDYNNSKVEGHMDLKCFELVQFTATATFPTNIQLAFLHRSEGHPISLKWDLQSHKRGDEDKCEI